MYTYFLPSNGPLAHLTGRIALAIGSAYCPDQRSPLLACGQWWAPRGATLQAYGLLLRTVLRTICTTLTPSSPRGLRPLVLSVVRYVIYTPLLSRTGLRPVLLRRSEVLVYYSLRAVASLHLVARMKECVVARWGSSAPITTTELRSVTRSYFALRAP